MTIAITVRGLDEALRELDDATGRLADLTPVMQVIAEDVKTLIDDSFEESRKPNGRPWAPLAPETVKRRRNNSNKPLIDTGVLRNSINARPGPRSVRFGTNVPYAEWHQFGTESIIARPFFPVDEAGREWEQSGPAGEELERIVETITRYIMTGEIR